MWCPNTLFTHESLIELVGVRDAPHREALMAHPRAKLTPLGRSLLVQRVLVLH